MKELSTISVLSVTQDNGIQQRIRRSLTEFNTDNYLFQFHKLESLAAAEPIIAAGGNAVLLLPFAANSAYTDLPRLTQKYEHLPIIALIVDNDIDTTEKVLDLGISQVAWLHHLPGRSLCQQIYASFERYTLLKEAKQQASLAQIFHDTGLMLNASLGVGEIFERFLDQLAHLVGFTSAAVFFVQDGWATIAHHRGYDDYSAEQIANIRLHVNSNGPLREAVRRNGHRIPDVRQAAEWKEIMASERIRSWICLPLYIQGELKALFSLDHRRANFFTAQDLDSLQSLGNVATLALNNAQHFAHMQASLDELNTIQAISQATNQADEIDTLLSQVTEHMAAIVPGQEFGFLMPDSSGRMLRAHSSYRSRHNDVPDIPTQDLGQALANAPTGAILSANGRRLLVPLLGDNEILGVIAVAASPGRRLTPRDERLLTTLAGQIGTALQKLRLLESERLSKVISERIRRASLSLTQTLDRSEVLERILAELNNVVVYESASIVLHLAGQCEIVATKGLPTDMIGRRFPLENAQTLQMEATGLPLYIPDTRIAGSFEPWLKGLPIISWIGVPLYARGQMVGHLSVDSVRPDAFSATQIAQVEAFASHAAIALDNATLYASERRARASEATIRHAIQAFTQFLESESVFDLLLEFLERLIPYRSANIMLLGPNNEVELKSLRGYDEFARPEAIQAIDLSLNTHPILYKLLVTGESQLIRYTATEECWRVHEPTNYVQSFLGVPLISQGVILGCFQLDHDQPGFFTEEHRELAETISGPAAAALQNAYLLETAQHTAIQVQTSQSIIAQLNGQTEVKGLIPSIVTQLGQIGRAVHTIYMSYRDDELQIVSAAKLGDLPPVFGPPMLGKLASCLNGQEYFASDIDVCGNTPFLTLMKEMGVRSCLMVPVKLTNRVIGLLAISWNANQRYDARQLPFFRQVSSALGLALERSRLYLETKRRATEQALLNEITQEFAHQLDPIQYYVSVVHALRKHLNYPYVGLLEFDKAADKLVVRAHTGLFAVPQIDAPDYPELLRRQLNKALDSGKPQLLNDIRAEIKTSALRLTQIRSALAMPILSGARVFGVLSVQSPEIASFSEQDIDLLNAIVDQLVLALDKVFLFEQTQQRTAELGAISEFTSAMRMAEGIEAVMQILVDHAKEKLASDMVSIFLVNDAGDEIEVAIDRPVSGAQKHHYPTGGGIVSDVLTSGEYRIASHLQPDDSFGVLNSPDLLGDLASAIFLPLKTASRTFGVLRVAWATEHHVSSADIRLLNAFVEVASTAMERSLILTTLEDRVVERTQQLAEANERLQELDLLKSKFVSDVTHELRTPITNLGLYMELLTNGRPEKYDQYLAVLHRQVDRLGTLVQDILSLSRLDLGKIDATAFRTFDFNKVVEQAINPYLPRFEEAALGLEMNLAPDLPQAFGEPNQMAQVINCLLSNALTYTSAGVVVIETWSQGHGADAAIKMSICDSGMGIPDDELPLIYDRFYRGINAGQSTIPGSGLGLAIVKEIMDLHQGRVRARNNPEGGCTFTIQFPLAQPA